MIKNILTVIVFICFIGTLGCAHIQNVNPFKKSSNATVEYTNGFKKSTSYDFPDVPIPQDLKIDIKRSLVFESPEFKVGVLVYRGRVDSLSLFEYFVKKLPEYNWKLRSYFKYGKYILLFSKQEKDLVLQIKDKGYTTEVFIWVVPRTKESQSANSNVIQEEEIKP